MTAERAASARPAAGGEPLPTFGPWQVLEVLGDGASGRVYLACRRDLGDGRRVAIKTLHHPSASALARFELERQALARLEHPNIARLYDAGPSEGPGGVPYVVLEHVDGQPIDRYCEQQQLGLEQRIRLFLEVCRGVQHAHRNLIVHRDLKPANILVDADGRPRLLDFGIARLLDAPTGPGGEATQLAEATARTPAYASPEQIRGGTITTATDVFSLGIVLYQLLTGQLPWGDRGSRHQLERAICEEEPLPAGRRQRRLRGNLEAILAKALARRPEERYASVEAFARDLENHLAHLPTLARPGGLLRRAGLTLRRHLGAATAALMFGGALAVFLLVLSAQARLLRGERDKAEQALAFLVEVFRAGAPGAENADQLTARQILERAAGRVARELRQQPEAQATLFSAIGAVYFSLGHYREAARLHQDALSRQESFARGDEAALATTRFQLAEALVMAGEIRQSEQLYREALAARRRLLPQAAPELIEIRVGLATALESREAMKEAIVLRREIVALTAHAEAGQRLLVLGTLAAALANDRDYEDADQVNNEAWALAQRSDDVSTPAFADGLFEVAVAMSYDLDPRALTLFERSLAIRRRLLPPDHPRLLESEQSVAAALMNEERWQEARELLEKVTRAKARQLGPSHFLTASAELDLALCIGELGDWDQAVALVEGVLARAQAIGRPPGELAGILARLSSFERRQGRLDQAWEHLLRGEKYLLESKAERPALVELLVRQAGLEADRGQAQVALERLELLVGEMKNRFPIGDWRLAWADSERARVLALLGRDRDAELLAQSCYNQLSASFGPRSRQLRAPLLALQLVYRGRGDQARQNETLAWLEDPRTRPARLGSNP